MSFSCIMHCTLDISFYQSQSKVNGVNQTKFLQLIILQCRKQSNYEILFSTRFSTTFSTIFSTRFENIKIIVYQYLSEQLLTTKIFLHKTPYTPALFHKKVCALQRRCFYKRPLFTTFLIDFTVDEVCYISNKHQTLNNLAIYQYFYTRDFISLRHFEKKIGALHRKRFSKHPLFTTFSLFLKMSDVCNISSKC